MERYFVEILPQTSSRIKQKILKVLDLSFISETVCYSSTFTETYLEHCHQACKMEHWEKIYLVVLSFLVSLNLVVRVKIGLSAF